MAHGNSGQIDRLTLTELYFYSWMDPRVGWVGYPTQLWWVVGRVRWVGVPSPPNSRPDPIVGWGGPPPEGSSFGGHPHPMEILERSDPCDPCRVILIFWAVSKQVRSRTCFETARNLKNTGPTFWGPPISGSVLFDGKTFHPMFPEEYEEVSFHFPRFLPIGFATLQSARF